MNDLVEFLPVLFGDFYACFLEDILQVPEITCHNNRLQVARTLSCVIKSLSITALTPFLGSTT